MNGYDEKECLVYKDVIRENALLCMKNLIAATKKFNYSISSDLDESCQKITNFVIDINFSKNFTPDYGTMIAKLWQDDAIQKAFQRRDEFQLLDSAE